MPGGATEREAREVAPAAPTRPSRARLGRALIFGRGAYRASARQLRCFPKMYVIVTLLADTL